MAFARIADMSESEENSDDAIRQGIARANKTLRNVKSAWIKCSLRASRTDGKRKIR